MKIVHLTKYLFGVPGGIERVTREMAIAAVGTGAEVDVIGISPQFQGPMLEAPQQGINDFSLPILFRIGPVPVAPKYLFLREKLLNADLVHLHLPNPIAELSLLWFLYSCKRHKNKPLIVPITDSGILRWPRLAKIWETLIQKRLLQQADSILVSAPQLLDIFPTFGAFREKSYIIPFPVRPPPPSYFSRRIETLSTMRLLAVGRLVWYKGFDVLLDAVVNLPGNWQLTIAGQGPEGKVLKAKINRLGLLNKVTIFEGLPEDIKHELMENCDLFIAPSQTEAESFGMAIVEAFAHGKPVITTNLKTGVAFLARNGACGAIVPVQSVSELRSAIIRMMNDPARRYATGNANLDFWRKELSLDAFQRKYQKFLEHLGLLVKKAA
ncbi:MAG: glycosyltransferase [Deltaproteobacteria bacterium]|nr:glycosyltransferase [Deltaproteobacteria bacterium]